MVTGLVDDKGQRGLRTPAPHVLPAMGNAGPI